MANMTGSCLCGAVKFEIEGDPMMAANCHCSRCRRMTGAAYEPAMVIGTQQLKITSGEDNIQLYKEEGFNNRSFCTTCGSTTFAFQWPDGPMTVVPMGSLDDAGVAPPAMHIHVGSKAAWHEITDDLPQEQGMPAM